jgi:sugar transferase EpsL
MYRRVLKPVIDRMIALALLLVLAPLLAGIAIAVGFLLGRPILFRQRRPGHRGKVFTLLKFRTMSDTRDDDGRLLEDRARLNGFGRFLRSTSLDELPELINVLKGEMSLVGPRPLLCQYLARYSAEQARRHEVKPGITGWAQINGRNALSWEEKFRLDVWYVDRVSFFLDARIICRTVAQVFRRVGINHATSETAPEFLGTNERV